MISPRTMLPWLSLLPLLACGGTPVALTTATTQADALLMARVVGHWEATTPEGPVALDPCENAARLTLPSLLLEMLGSSAYGEDAALHAAGGVEGSFVPAVNEDASPGRRGGS